MKKSLIQQKVIEAIEYTRNDKGHSEFGGFDNGTIKKVIIDCEFNGKHESQGKIAFFYKNCKTFLHFQNKKMFLSVDQLKQGLQKPTSKEFNPNPKLNETRPFRLCNFYWQEQNENQLELI